MEKPIAVQEWYKGLSEYDFKTSDMKKGGDAAKMAKFTQLIWKATSTVGFGVKGKYVVAWFCPK